MVKETMENKKKEEESFWDTASENYEEVKGWSDWKKSIVISAVTASTGQFIQSHSSQVDG